MRLYGNIVLIVLVYAAAIAVAAADVLKSESAAITITREQIEADWLRRRGNALWPRPANIFQRLEERPAEVIPLVAILDRELEEGVEDHNPWSREEMAALVRARQIAERLEYLWPDRSVGSPRM